MRKKKVMHITGTMDMGGSETYLMNILRFTDPKKYKFYFLCFGDKHFDYEDEIIKLGHEIIRIESLRKSGPIMHIVNVIREIHKHNIDAIETHIYPNSFYYLLASFIAGIKIRIAHSHTAKPNLSQSTKRKIYNNFARKLTVLFSTKRVACGNLAGTIAFGRDNFSILNNFVDIDKYKFSDKKRQYYRQKIGVNETTILVGNVARFEIVKNHTYMIKLIKLISQKKDNVNLLLVGEGPEKLKIELLARKLGVETKVIFFGKSKDTAGIYSAMDVFILPSLWEGMPLSLIEAQASGLNCVVSKNVDNSSDITGLTKFLPINKKSLMYWSDSVQDFSKSKRGNLILETSKFDISSNYQKVLDMYGELKK